MDKKQKQILGIVIGALVLIMITGAVIMKRSSDSKENQNQIEMLKKTKQLTLKENNKFISITGKDLTDRDMKVIFNGSGQEKPVYWTIDSTTTIPTDYEETLIGYIEQVESGELIYSKFDKEEEVEADADRISDWKVIGEKSETKDGILTIIAEFKDMDISTQDVQAQAKGIFEITDNLNEKKNYQSKVLSAIDANNIQYIVDENQKNMVKTIVSIK